MKIRKIIVNVLAVIMMCVSTLCFTACNDIVVLKVKFQAYDYENSKMFGDDELVLEVDLYRHLAPETVDSILGHVENGLYNGAIVYKYASGNTNQYMMGDLKYDEDGNIIQVVTPEIKGEFSSNGVVGSNLKVNKGSIGLWRSYYSCDSGMTVSSDARDSGRATWFMPTQSNSIYEGKVCIFGQVDLEDDTTKAVYKALEAVFASVERYEEYQVYYTGTYDETKADENYGLTFNILPIEDYDEDEIDNLFTTDDQLQQLKCYDPYVIRIPVALNNGQGTLKIASVTVK